MKTLYVHIGTMKTGSSAVQDFLYNNTEYLKNNGYVYPKSKYKYPLITPKRNGSFLGTPAINYDKLEDIDDNALLDEEIKYIDECLECHDNAILSEETAWYHITDKRKETWNTLVQHFQSKGVVVKVLVYLRRQDLFVESYWKQLVKHNKYRWNIEHFLEKRAEIANLDYYANLERIAETVGKENIIVRRYQMGALLGDDIILDFLDALNLPIDDVRNQIENNKRRNPSITNNATAIAIQLNRTPNITKEQSRRLEPYLFSVSEVESKRKTQYSMFTAEEARALVEQYGDSNNKVAIEYIGDNEPLFNDVYNNGEKWSLDNPYYISDVIRFMGAAMNDMLDKIEDQERRIKALENSNKGRRYHLRKLVSPK